MGIFDELFFAHKKVISETKFKRVREILRAKGMSELHRNDLQGVFLGDLYEPGTAKGIDKKEFEERIKWMRENKSKHRLSDTEIDTAEEVMSKML